MENSFGKPYEYRQTSEEAKTAGKIRERREEGSRIWTESEYVDKCVKHALEIGWVEEGQKEDLIERCLKPIHKKYLEIIQDLREAQVPEDELKRIILKMNGCLESTKRIGSTPPNNIIESINGPRKLNPEDTNTEYAMTALVDFIRSII